MSRLLVATDHIFESTSEGVFDSYCFDRAFFDDYRAVFEEVVVAARIRPVQHVSPGGRRADGAGVRFLSVGDRRGAGWMLRSVLPAGASIRQEVRVADAICVRLPSGLGSIVARSAGATPYMVELIGDPAESIRASAPGLSGAIAAALSERQTRGAIRRACCVSYVSFGHLQAAYPAPEGTPTDAISSVRLADAPSPPRHVDASPAPLRLVLTASLVAVKGHIDLLRALAIAREAGGSFRLDLLGDGPERPSLEREVQTLDLHEAVTFHGHVGSRRELEQLLCSSHLFVMPSHSEGMPRAMIEAMSLGLPAIGSDVPGIAELVPASQRFPARDPASLAEALLACRDPAVLNRMADRSASMVTLFRASLLSEKRQALLRHLEGSS